MITARLTERITLLIGSVSSFDVNLESQLVNVKGPIEQEALVEKIRKTGKQVRPRSWFSRPGMTY
jgi:hypothetical protein